MSTSAVFKFKDPSLYNQPAGQAGLAFENDPAGRLRYCGDLTMDFEKSATKTEIKTSEAPGSPVVATDFDEITGTVKMTFRQLDEFALALAFMGEAKSYVQAAVASRPQTINDVRLGDLLELKESDALNAQGVINTVVTAVEADGEVLTLGTHYRHDSASGIVQIVDWPVGIDDGAVVEVTFSAPAITADAKRSLVEILQTTQFTARVVVRQNNKRGRNRKFVYPKITFGPESGSVSIITAPGTNEPTAVELTGTLEFDTRQPQGRERGYIVDIG